MWKRRRRQTADPKEKKPKKGRIKRFIKRAFLWSYLGCAAIGITTDIIAAKYAPKKFDPLVKKYTEQIKRGNFAERLEKNLIKEIAKIKKMKPESLEGKIKIKQKDWINGKISQLEFGKNIKTLYTSFDIIWEVGPIFLEELPRPVVRVGGMILYPYLSAQHVVAPLLGNYGIADVLADRKPSVYVQPLSKIQMLGDKNKLLHEYYKLILNHEILHLPERRFLRRPHPYRTHEFVEFLAEIMVESNKPTKLQDYLYPSSEWIREWIKGASPELINLVINDIFSGAEKKAQSKLQKSN
jgi:hypothetical protein